MASSIDPSQYAVSLLRSPARPGQTLWMEVRGNSMYPTLLPSDRVEVEGVEPADLRFADLAVVHAAEVGCVIHRFFGWRDGDPPRLKTKGDASARFDPPWPSARLLGRVRLVERQGRRWKCGRTWLLAGAIRSLLVWCWAGINPRLRARGNR